MTASTQATWPEDLHGVLRDPRARNAVESAVRRRVPASDAPDVVQAVFCEALAAQTVPTGGQRMARWLTGIARHLSVDYFRARPRELSPHSRVSVGLEDEWPSGGEVAQACDPAPFEAREAIDRVLGQLDADAKKTLRWMLLESEGTQLQDIARAEKISATAVRARVYRLRRTLRRDLSCLLVAVGALVLTGEVAHWAYMPSVRHVAVGQTASVPSWLVGAFTVRETAGAPTSVRAFLSRAGGTIFVESGEVRIGGVRFGITEAAPEGEGLRLSLEDELGHRQAVHVERTNDGGIVASCQSPPLVGTLSLDRR